jgi:predicted NBD/HSP70 family sugar kinase
LTHLAGSSRLLRAMNESAALAHLLEHGQLTRAELRELTGLSKPTISDAVRRLSEAGLAVVVGHVSAGPGPNAEVYAANPDAAYAVAISIRETAFTDEPALVAAVCDVSGEVRARVERPVDFERTDPVDVVAHIVDELRAKVGGAATGTPEQRGIGYVQIGVAGAYDPRTETIHHVDVPGWNRPGLVGELRRRIGLRVGVDNDVNLAAIAERGRGVARDAEGFALLWFGEGLGLAIDLNGTLLRGARGGAGEIGYMPLYTADGRPHGDFQDLVGGRAVLSLASEHGIPGETPAEAVAAAAEFGGTGDAFLAALAGRIVVGLAAVVAVLDPPLVVLTGEVAQAGGAALCDAVAAALQRTASLETAVEITSITEDAVLLGGLDAGLAEVRAALLASLRR